MAKTGEWIIRKATERRRTPLNPEIVSWAHALGQGLSRTLASSAELGPSVPAYEHRPPKDGRLSGMWDLRRHPVVGEVCLVGAAGFRHTKVEYDPVAMRRRPTKAPLMRGKESAGTSNPARVALTRAANMPARPRRMGSSSRSPPIPMLGRLPAPGRAHALYP